jgi:hypothetical protein
MFSSTAELSLHIVAAYDRKIDFALIINLNIIIILGNHKVIEPIQCTKPHNAIRITLVINGMLQFESRQIDGTFTRGYCMEILRGTNILRCVLIS